MSASHFVEEVGEDKFQPTPTSLALGDTAEPIAHTALVTGAQYTSSAMNLPAFLAKTDYREPVEATNTNFMDSNKDQLSLFAFLKTEPKSQAAFIGAMRGLSQRKRDWTEFYSTELLFEGFNPDKVLLVDIGAVTAIAKVSDQIQLMPHDFFTPQPVKAERNCELT
ncbi:unnamed protein product [Parascedosporium putredinis]|uniref:Uncharacterized protein n=1 Tax=Parascedosporium putredinis TaxID=1442378 RepID=A0A9P1H2B3_9PEZI|nr:unnamed protein product [Parascedosporium putredinis]CAI7993874.1 unnamed protein product [Parascedosporium putredinis]